MPSQTDFDQSGTVRFLPQGHADHDRGSARLRRREPDYDPGCARRDNLELGFNDDRGALWSAGLDP